MKAFLLIFAGICLILSLILLTSCGTTREQRVKLYEAGAVIAGHPEAVPAIEIVSKLIPAKQPREALQP